jgi:hypothetical protein
VYFWLTVTIPHLLITRLKVAKSVSGNFAGVAPRRPEHFDAEGQRLKIETPQ